ncbi:hypothetical protein HMPREF0043_00539 [Actinobaculum sp. oral taxon 183 str. F0552]|nr:hypothetical protein HMPREF0043_00539 [Actinobaculum sp. oral taxon 183 str. F0552]
MESASFTAYCALPRPPCDGRRPRLPRWRSLRPGACAFALETPTLDLPISAYPPEPAPV